MIIYGACLSKFENISSKMCEKKCKKPVKDIEYIFDFDPNNVTDLSLVQFNQTFLENCR